MPRFMRRNSKSSCELHKAIVNNDWIEARSILQSDPSSSRKQTVAPSFFGQVTDILPLHQACASKTVPHDFLKDLVLAYPESIVKPETALKRIALHIAVKSNIPNESILFLARYYPESTRIKDKLGRVPLHYALSNLLPYDVVRQLVEVCPDSVAAVDNYNWTPLHVATNMAAPREIISLLVKERPEVISMKTDGGSTALRLAMESSSIDKDMIMTIIREGENQFRNKPIFQNLEEAERKERHNTVIDNDKSEDNEDYLCFVMKQRSYASSVV